MGNCCNKGIYTALFTKNQELRKNINQEDEVSLLNSSKCRATMNSFND